MRRSLSVAITIMFLAAFVVALAAPTVRAENITLTYSNFFPPTHVQSKLAESWCQEVEKRTEGRVKVQYFPGQTLTKGNVCYDGVVNGLSDMGLSVLAYTRGRFPVMEVVDLPLGYKNGRQATAVINEVYEKLQPKELMDTQVMYLHAHGPGFPWTRKKEVHKLEDMKGLKLRAHGTSAKIVEKLGATPVAKPMPETYQMLQKGVCDGAMYPPESNKGWKLGEVVDYGILAYGSAYTTSFFVVMNKNKWAKISPEDQKVIMEINKEWSKKTGEAWDSSDEEGIAFFKEKGGKLIPLDDAENARWAEAVKPILTEYVDKTNQAGLPGDQALAAAQEAVKKFGEMYK